MKPVFSYGDVVRIIRNVRNDGTYPGKEIGEPLIRRGSVGHVQNIGTYLQDYTIYSVHFLEQDMLVGCKEEELIAEDAEWIDSLYEFREKVVSKISLSVKGEVIVKPGDKGEVLKVLREHSSGVHYHIRFPGRTLLVPEASLDSIEGESER